MSPEEKIEKKIQKMSFKAGEDMRKKILQDALKAQLKTKQTDSAATRPNIRRIIMKSPIIKLAAAAVIVAAVLFFFTETGSVTLAAVAEKVKQFDSLIQREERTLTVVGQQQPSMIFDAKKYVLTDEGSVEEQYDQNGNLVTTVYLLKDKQQVITVLHPPKQYFIIDLKGTALELPQSFNARGLVEWIVLESNPVKLGQKEIDGRKAEGFEVVNPKAVEEMAKLSNGMFPIGDNTWRLWVDVETKLPIKIEGECVMGKGPLTNFTEIQMEFETTGIEWGAEFDKSIFEPDIPDDYTLLDTSNFTQ